MKRLMLQRQDVGRAFLKIMPCFSEDEKGDCLLP